MLLSTGALARMCGVEKGTLRFYDKEAHSRKSSSTCKKDPEKLLKRFEQKRVLLKKERAKIARQEKRLEAIVNFSANNQLKPKVAFYNVPLHFDTT